MMHGDMKWHRGRGKGRKRLESRRSIMPELVRVDGRRGVGVEKVVRYKTARTTEVGGGAEREKVLLKQ